MNRLDAEVHEPDARVTGADTALVQAISKAELDQRISTARAFPRSLKKFADECLEMATLNPRVAAECIYALPRDGKTIAGPSARLAEIVASAWGNCQAGARVVEEGDEFITAQGVFHDLERNVSITYEVRRRITDKHGRRFKPDMIGVTANAACSIALRNAVFKGVPKAFWVDAYDSARKAVAGDIKTLATRRADAIAAFKALDVTQEMILRVLGVAGIQDIGLDELTTLIGIFNAIKEGDTTVEEAFAPKAGTATAGGPAKSRTEEVKDKLGMSAAPKNGSDATTKAVEDAIDAQIAQSATPAADTADVPAEEEPATDSADPDDPRTWGRRRLLDSIGTYTGKANRRSTWFMAWVKAEQEKFGAARLGDLSDAQLLDLYSRLIAESDRLDQQPQKNGGAR